MSRPGWKPNRSYSRRAGRPSVRLAKGMDADAAGRTKAPESFGNKCRANTPMACRSSHCQPPDPVIWRRSTKQSTSSKLVAAMRADRCALVDFAHERALKVWHRSKQRLDLSSHIQPRSNVIKPGVHDLHSALPGRHAWRVTKNRMSGNRDQQSHSSHVTQDNLCDIGLAIAISPPS